MNMMRPHTLAIALLLAFPLAACNKANPNETVGQKLDRAVDTTKEKVAAAGDKIEQKTDQIANKIETSETKEKLDDTAITASVKAGLLKDPDLSAIKIEVETTNGVVALNGVADNPVARDRAGTIAKSVKGVNEVHNNVVVRKS
jgi:hyperosmotically inducible periplasmic protein